MRQPEETTESPLPQPPPNLFRRLGNWLFSQRHFHFKLLSGTAVGAVVIFLLVGIFLYITLRNHAQETLRSHTIEVIRVSSLVENDIAALETGHRGFLLTGDQGYVASFERRRELIHRRLGDLTKLIDRNDRQSKRLTKVQDVVTDWINNVALPEIAARSAAPATVNPAPTDLTVTKAPIALGNTLLDRAREALQSLQDEEQIVLNQRMAEEEWAAQSTQMLDFLPKLERSAIEMEKEKRGYLLTGDTVFAESYQRAITDFWTYNGYLSILVASTPARAELLANIRSEVERWIATSNGDIEARRAGKAIQLGSINAAETLMKDVRQQLTDFQSAAVTDYETRTAAASQDRIIKTSVMALLAFLAITLLAVSNRYSFVMVRHQLAEMQGVETKIRSIIENMLDGMITVDDAGMISSINPAAEKMFGYNL